MAVGYVGGIDERRIIDRVGVHVGILGLDLGLVGQNLQGRHGSDKDFGRFSTRCEQNALNRWSTFLRWRICTRDIREFLVKILLHSR